MTLALALSNMISPCRSPTTRSKWETASETSCIARIRVWDLALSSSNTVPAWCGSIAETGSSPRMTSAFR